MAGEPRDALIVDAPVSVANVAPMPEAFAGGGLSALGAALRSAQMAGALDAILRMTIDHTRERAQFGRPIGGFQAVQQQLAAMAGQVAAARVAADLGMKAMTDNLDREGIAVAKIRAGEAASLAAATAHQIHGAMGFTLEHDLQRFTRRLWSWRDEYGGEILWAERLGSVLASAGADRLWPALTAL
jgi:acyl-CoA dehydrogenase